MSAAVNLLDQLGVNALEEVTRAPTRQVGDVTIIDRHSPVMVS